MSDDHAKAWGCLAIFLTGAALPAAVAISVLRDMFRRLVHYDQTGEW